MNAATTALPALQFLANTAQNHPGLGKALLAAMTSLASSNQPSTITPNGALNTSASPNPTTQPLPGSNLCDFCKVKPKFHDGSRYHSYCSKTCATNAASTSNGNTNQPAIGTCVVCNSQPQYYDSASGKVHPYCSKSCAAKAAKRPKTSQRRTTSPGQKPANNTAPPVTPPTQALCKIPGCQRTCFQDNSGSLSDYCGLGHKKLAQEACLWCHKVIKSRGHFCSKTCTEDAQKGAPLLLEVPEGHATFKSVADQFKVSWRHTGKKCPTVRHVYKIIGQQSFIDSYNTYLDKVEAAGKFQAAGRSRGNENRRWHGTRRECSLGDKGVSQLCSSPTCSLCCIVRTSFDLACFGKKTSWGRFGQGIYTSSTSSKSDDYSSNDGSSTSKLKAIMLNKVVVGKGCKMTHDNTTLKAPPPGFDSVLAEKGGSLNHDELVVYTNDAIRPSFLVMYEK